MSNLLQFETKNTTIRPITLEDATTLFSIFDNSEFKIRYGQKLPTSIDETRIYIQEQYLNSFSTDRTFDSQQSAYINPYLTSQSFCSSWVIISKDTTKLIGVISFHEGLKSIPPTSYSTIQWNKLIDSETLLQPLDMNRIQLQGINQDDLIKQHQNQQYKYLNILEMQYMIDSQYWGQGILQESCRELLQSYIWTQIQPDLILTMILSDNFFAQTFTRKLGSKFTFEFSGIGEYNNKSSNTLIFTLHSPTKPTSITTKTLQQESSVTKSNELYQNPIVPTNNPCFESERLILRPMTMDDCEAVYEYAKTPLCGPRCGWAPHKSLEDTKWIMANLLLEPVDPNRIKKSINNTIPYKPFTYHPYMTKLNAPTFAIIVKETGRLIGSIVLKDSFSLNLAKPPKVENDDNNNEEEASWYDKTFSKQVQNVDSKQFDLTRIDPVIQAYCTQVNPTIDFTQYPYNEWSNIVEIGYSLHPDEWGKGYATEASELLIQYAFTALSSSCVLITPCSYNSRSNRICEKVGGKFITLQKNAFRRFYDGEIFDSMIYVVTPESFQLRKQQ